jgi:hypothetical protein
MASDKLAIVIGYRNRDLKRVERCLHSLARQTRNDFRVYFVDYGSHLSFARSVQSLVEQFPFCRYIYTHTRGWPWNRAKALNIGIQLAETDYVLTTDIDIIFAPNFVETLLKAQDGVSVIYCAARWLPKTFTDWERIDDYAEDFPKRKRRPTGLCQCVPLSVMHALGGFDEQFEYWGAEDRDLHLRLMAWGLRERWVDDQTTLFHQWHPIDRGGAPRRYRDRWRNPYMERVSTQLIRNKSGWGAIMRREQRPLFDLLPEAETQDMVDWPTLLTRLAQVAPMGDLATRWLITDRPKGSGWLAAAQAGYRRAVIAAPWMSYIIRRGEEIEHRVEPLFVQALETLHGTSSASPGLIVLDLATLLRISRNLFVHLLETLTPGGMLVIGSLHEPRLPTGMRCLSALLSPPLKGLYELLWRVPKARRLCELVLTALQATPRSHNLRDSIYLARVGVTGILDFTLDFPAAGSTAIFVKGA